MTAPPPAPNASEIAAAVRERRRSAVDVTQDALARITRQDPTIHAFLQTFPEQALAQAQRVDAAIAAGNGHTLPLAGVPVALKDNICLSFGRTTCGSRILENYESPFTATAAQLLIDAGAVIIGKTNLDEFAMGSSTEYSAFGPTRNPWDVSRVPGGSSGGSAAAVAARICPLALGSDTGGSIRQPASMCGVVGVKPTYGRISRYGLVAYASSLDQIGPIATTVVDAAIALDVLCHHDPMDSTSVEGRRDDFASRLEEPIANLRIGVPTQARSSANDPGVARVFADTIATFEKLGADIVEVNLPMTDAGIAAYYIVALAEASSNLARFDGIRYGRRASLSKEDTLADLYCKSRAEGFGDEVKRRIMLGTHVLSSGYYDAYYNTALRARRRILEDFERAFGGASCHAVLMPTAPNPAFRIGEKTSDPLAMYLEDVYTVGANLAGLPAMSVPAGFVVVGAGKTPYQLPVGAQLVCPAFSESIMLRAARMFERATDHAQRTPSIVGAENQSHLA